MQNEYYYKSELNNAIETWLEKMTAEDNDFGYIPANMAQNMTEATWLIIKQNIDTNKYFETEVIPSNS